MSQKEIHTTDVSLSSPSKWQQCKRLLALVRPHGWLFTFGMLALLMGSAINLYLPQLAREYLNQSSGITDSPLSQIVLAFLFLFAVQGLAFYFRSYAFAVIGQKIVRKLRVDLFASLITHPISFFDRSKVGDLTSRLVSDCAAVQDALSIRLSVLVRYSFQVLVGLVLMLLLSWRLTLFVALIIPIIVFLSLRLGKRLKSLSKRLQNQLASASSIAEEAFGNIRIVKAFQAAHFERDRFDRNVAEVEEIGIRRARIAAFFSSFVSFLMNASLAIVLAYGIILVQAQALPIGDLTAFLLYGLIVGISFAFLAGGFTEILQALGASERVYEILSHRTEESLSSTPITSHGAPELAFRSLSFAYPERPMHKAVQELSLEVAPTSSLAIIGHSGAGKSTIFQLLLGFYTPQSGKILVNGKDIQSYTLQERRSLFSLVPQEPLFFHASLRENLLYAKPSASDQELLQTLQRAKLDQLLAQLPKGLDTEIGERGIQLSGGERQRLALARVLLRDAPILLLDEATSALDSESEAAVQRSLQDVMQGRTTLCIAHRLSTVQNFDSIAILENGKLLAVGSHQELLSRSAAYRRMVELQSQNTQSIIENSYEVRQ